MFELNKELDIKDFESRYRNQMSETLNDLQTATLLLAQLQLKINQIGSSVQSLSQNVEEFITQQGAK